MVRIDILTAIANYGVVSKLPRILCRETPFIYRASCHAFVESIFIVYSLVLRNGKFLVYTLFSVKVTNIYPSLIAHEARIMAKRPIVLK